MSLRSTSTVSLFMLLGLLLACKSTDPEAKKFCEEEAQARPPDLPGEALEACTKTYSALKKEKPAMFSCIKQHCLPQMQAAKGDSNKFVEANSCKLDCMDGKTPGAGADPEAKRIDINNQCLKVCGPPTFEGEGENLKIKASHIECMSKCCRDKGMETDCKK